MARLPTGPLHVLAFEPHDAGSHRAVRESISRHSKHRWRWFTRPGRAWKWRMRIGAIELIDTAEAAGAFERGVDAIFATSLLAATDLIAMLPKALRAVPMILYMHENQAAYPVGHETTDAAARDVHFAITNLTSILAADLTIFNSEWNRRSFIKGIEEVLHHASDGTVRDLRARIEAQSCVVWPPVEVSEEWVDRGRAGDLAKPQAAGETVLHNAVRVVWPHRWEHDKGPDELLEIAARYTEPLNLRWTILGERYREIPPALEAFGRRFADRIDHVGYVADVEAYRRILAECDWVLSTARHEFFGIAVVEALLAGCLPWLPNRLSYAEILPEIARGLSPSNPPDEADAVRTAIRNHLGPAVASNAVRRIDEAIERVVANAIH